jgi:hypothetical protein
VPDLRFNSKFLKCFVSVLVVPFTSGSRARGGAASHPREKTALPPPPQFPIQGGGAHNLFYFWIVAIAVIAHCIFSIREAASVTMADVPPALTGVSPEAQELMAPERRVL